MASGTGEVPYQEPCGIQRDGKSRYLMNFLSESLRKINVDPRPTAEV